MPIKQYHSTGEFFKEQEQLVASSKKKILDSLDILVGELEYNARILKLSNDSEAFNNCMATLTFIRQRII